MLGSCCRLSNCNFSMTPFDKRVSDQIWQLLATASRCWIACVLCSILVFFQIELTCVINYLWIKNIPLVCTMHLVLVLWKKILNSRYFRSLDLFRKKKMAWSSSNKFRYNALSPAHGIIHEKYLLPRGTIFFSVNSTDNSSVLRLVSINKH